MGTEIQKFGHTIAFQSALHDNSNTWEDAGPLKVENLVNAGKFNNYLQSDPLIFLFFWQLILKERAF